jgi:hypothetical protein
LSEVGGGLGSNTPGRGKCGSDQEGKCDESE